METLTQEPIRLLIIFVGGLALVLGCMLLAAGLQRQAKKYAREGSNAKLSLAIAAPGLCVVVLGTVAIVASLTLPVRTSGANTVQLTANQGFSFQSTNEESRRLVDQLNRDNGANCPQLTSQEQEKLKQELQRIIVQSTRELAQDISNGIKEATDESAHKVEKISNHAVKHHTAVKHTGQNH